MWAAQLLSQTGDRFFALAIMWLALERSGPLAMGAVAVAESVPYIVLGACGHRLLTRCLSFTALASIDALRAVLTAVLPWAWTMGGTPAMLSTVTLLGILGAAFDPCLGTLVPDLVAPDDRAEAVTLMDLTSRLARIGGPALAALLLMVCPITTLFAIDAATFAASAIALLTLPRKPFGLTKFEPGRSPPQLGYRHILREYRHLSTAFAVQGIGFLLMALPAIGLPLLLVQHLNAGPETYGWLLTSIGIASVLGNLTALHVTGGRFPLRFCAAWTATGILHIAIGTAHSVPLIALFATTSGYLGAIIAITMSTHLSSFESAVRLRLLTLNHIVMRTAGTAGMIAIPALIASSPARGFVLGGIVLTTAAATAGIVAVKRGSRHTGLPQCTV